MLGTSRYRGFPGPFVLIHTDGRYCRAASFMGTPTVADASDGLIATADQSSRSRRYTRFDRKRFSFRPVCVVWNRCVAVVGVRHRFFFVLLCFAFLRRAATTGHLQVSPIPRNRRTLTLYRVRHPSRSCTCLLSHVVSERVRYSVGFCGVHS